MSCRSRTFVLLVVALGLTSLRASPVARGRVAEVDDAFVEVDDRSERWTIGTSRILLTVSIGRRGELALETLAWPDGPQLLRADGPDALVTVDAGAAPLGAPGSGFAVSGVDAADADGGVELAVHLQQERGSLIATRHYRVRPGTAAVEVWTQFENTATDAVLVRDLNAFEVAVPNGRLHWVSGLDVSAREGRRFTRRSQDLEPGASLTIGSDIVSSSQAVPYLAVATPEATFFAGLAWSGSWTAFAERADGSVRVRMGLPSMSARVWSGEPVEGPHALLGVVPGDHDAASVAVQATLAAGHRTFPALTTFNSWFVHGIDINDTNMRDAIDQTSRTGFELFQLDAGWYPRDHPESMWDFTNGLGSWTVDRQRFPRGLGAVGDHARANHMLFGVWVEPERVALSTVGRPGLAEERFLATHGGDYHPGRPNDAALDGQICLGERAAREWLLAKLTAFIDEARPDYLKWDYNRWMICDRPDHDHPVDGGNYAHVRGLYQVLQALRARFPELLVENCSSGGHRLDLGMARLTDVGWMDDTTAPSRHVRHNIQGLATVFPAPYLLSYVMPHEDEPMNATVDMATLARSRMMGTMGLAVDLHTIGERTVNGLEQEAHLARALRGYQVDAVTWLLTAQAGSEPAWDVVQQFSPRNQRGVLWAFDKGTESAVRVPLRGLDRDALYEIRSIDTQRRERFVGAVLVGPGLELRALENSRAQVFTIELVSAAARRR